MYDKGNKWYECDTCHTVFEEGEIMVELQVGRTVYHLHNSKDPQRECLRDFVDGINVQPSKEAKLTKLFLAEG